MSTPDLFTKVIPRHVNERNATQIHDDSVFAIEWE